MKLIAGASGVLGSGFCEVLRGRGEAFVAMDLPWGDPGQVADRVVAYWRAAEVARASDSAITLVWAAGRGSVGASEGAMATETEALEAVVAALAREARPDMGNCFLFASSAGGLYGGHGDGLITDVTPPAPITPYGREKLLQEGIVARLHESGTMRTLSCRFTNIYGLASGRLRRKGLVAALVESAMLRQPVRLFVSPDTRRDYLYNVDAARMALAEVDVAGGGGGGGGGMDAASDGPKATIIRSGSTMTIADLVASVSRVLRRRVPVVFAESPEGRVQPLVLRFPERSGIQAAVPTTSSEAAIQEMAGAQWR